MPAKRFWLPVLCLTLLLADLGILHAAPLPPRPDQPWTLSGRVFEGAVGDETTPLEGVTMALHGANSPYPDMGTPLATTVTDAAGWYGLSTSAVYEYYIVRELDPAGLASVDAASVGGMVRNSNWIEYPAPLTGRELTGNNFWDRPAEPYLGDNFDDGQVENWLLEPGWSVVPDTVGFFLHGSGASWAEPLVVDGWFNYDCQADVRLDSGVAHLSFRLSRERVGDSEWLTQRYILGLQENQVYLRKQIGTTFYDLYAGPAALALGIWHTVRVRADGPVIEIYIDGTRVARYADSLYMVDMEKPLLYGYIALETLAGALVDIDNLLVVGLPLIAVYPPYHWYRTGGPSGGLGYDVRIHPREPNLMFVTDNPSGVNMSTNGGRTWTQRNTGITARTGSSLDEIPIFALTIDAHSSNIVWAGTQNVRGIYYSTDTGASWHKRDNGVLEGNEISFRNFAIHPTNSDIVFAGAEIKTGSMGQEFDQAKGKIYKSIDRGQNWVPVWQGTAEADSLVRFILFDYADPQTIYASTGIFDREAWSDPVNPAAGVGILKSTDGGENWFPINNGIPVQDGSRFLGFLDMHPTNPLILMAAAGNNTWGNGGVFRTTDGGGSWTKVLADDIFTMVVFSPSQPDTVYAGSAAAVYRSDDGGGTWQKYQKPGEFNWGPPGVRAGVPIGAVVDPVDPLTVYINNYQGGNFLSTDGGQTWVDASKGYTGAKLSSIAVHPNNAAVVYTIGRSGPFRSLDAGDTWAGLAYKPASFPEWNAVAINPASPDEVLITDELEGAIVKSTDGGMSWRVVYNHPIAGTDCNPPLPQAQWCADGFWAVAYAPADPTIVYAGMRARRRNIDLNFPVRSSYGMYKSTDAGETWAEINSGLGTDRNVHDIAVHPTDPNTVYIGTWRDGLYRSTDGGQSWVSRNNGLKALDVRALAIDPTNPQTLYAGLGQGAGIYKSTDGGGQWTASNAGLNPVCPSYLLPIGGSVAGFSAEPPPPVPAADLYAALPWTVIWDLAIDPTDPQTLYAADSHAGVYLSTDGGGSWTPINDGLTMRAVTALSVSSDGQMVYAATWGGGVYRLGEIELRAIYMPLVIK